LAELGVAAGVGVVELAELGVAAGVVAAPGVDGPELAVVDAFAELADAIGICRPVAGPKMGRGWWLLAWLAPTAPVAIAELPAERLLVESREIAQSNLAIGLRAFGREDPDRFALTVLTNLLGRGMSSRLFKEVRERRGLAYSVGASTSRYNGVGSFAISAGVMSAEPTIFSCFRLSATVERPLKPMTIATTPKAIKIAPAPKPPHSKSFRTRSLLSRTAFVTRWSAVMVLMSCLQSLWWFRVHSDSSRPSQSRHPHLAL